MPELQLAVIDVQPGAAMESQSGLQLLRPRIHGACMGLNSRYAGNDTLLLMERVLQDLGAGVQFLRAQGYQKAVLVGNSGGASLSAFYQAPAEDLTIQRMVDVAEGILRL